VPLLLQPTHRRRRQGGVLPQQAVQGEINVTLGKPVEIPLGQQRTDRRRPATAGGGGSRRAAPVPGPGAGAP
jgi:hypothetical protein